MVAMEPTNSWSFIHFSLQAWDTIALLISTNGRWCWPMPQLWEKEKLRVVWATGSLFGFAGWHGNKWKRRLQCCRRSLKDSEFLLFLLRYLPIPWKKSWALFPVLKMKLLDKGVEGISMCRDELFGPTLQTTTLQPHACPSSFPCPLWWSLLSICHTKTRWPEMQLGVHL